MPLTELPVELIHRVCSNCGGSDIKNLRLVNTSIRAIADEYLLREIRLYFSRANFDAAINVTRHRTLLKGVRTLCFEADTLPKLDSFDAWKEEHEEQLEVCRRSRRAEQAWDASLKQPTSLWSLSRAYQRYRNLWADQKLLSTDSTASDTLEQVFRNCPRLDNVIISLGDEIVDNTTGCHPAFQKAMIWPLGDHEEAKTGTNAFHAVMTAACKSGKRLRSLAVGPLSVATFNLSPTEREKCYAPIAQVENLHIALVHSYTSEHGAPPWNRVLHEIQDGRLIRFFTSASNLQILSIKGPGSSTREKKLPLHQLVGDYKWSRLTKLRLESIECTAQSLAAFLHRHSDTLVGMHLVGLRLRSGSWMDFAVSIAGKMPLLREIRLRGEWDFDDWEGQKARLSFSCFLDEPNVLAVKAAKHLVTGGEFPPSGVDDQGNRASPLMQDRLDFDGSAISLEPPGRHRCK